jgi:hypothetical protein
VKFSAKNYRRKDWFVFLAALILLSSPGNAQDCVIKKVVGLYSGDISSVQRYASLECCERCDYYQVKYKLLSSSEWIKNTDHLTDTSYVFTGLEANTSYVVAANSNCNSGTSSKYKNLTIATTECDIPQFTSFQIEDDLSVTLLWESCSSNATVRFRLWVEVNGIICRIHHLVPLVSRVFSRIPPTFSRWLLVVTQQVIGPSLIHSR